MTVKKERRPDFCVLCSGYVLAMFFGFFGAIMGLIIMVKYGENAKNHGRRILFISFISLLFFVAYYCIIPRLFIPEELFVVLSPASLCCYGIFLILQINRLKKAEKTPEELSLEEGEPFNAVGLYPFLIGIWGITVILLKLHMFLSWPLLYGLRLSGCIFNAGTGCVSLFTLFKHRQHIKKLHALHGDSEYVSMGVLLSQPMFAFICIAAGMLIFLYELVFSYIVLL